MCSLRCANTKNRLQRSLATASTLKQKTSLELWLASSNFEQTVFEQWARSDFLICVCCSVTSHDTVCDLWISTEQKTTLRVIREHQSCVHLCANFGSNGRLQTHKSVCVCVGGCDLLHWLLTSSQYQISNTRHRRTVTQHQPSHFPSHTHTSYTLPIVNSLVRFPSFTLSSLSIPQFSVILLLEPTSRCCCVARLQTSWRSGRSVVPHPWWRNISVCTSPAHYQTQHTKGQQLKSFECCDRIKMCDWSEMSVLL